jgi:hypothetical protein
MNTIIRILILGGSFNRQVVQKCDSGHKLTTVIRYKSRLNVPKNMRIVRPLSQPRQLISTLLIDGGAIVYA